MNFSAAISRSCGSIVFRALLGACGHFRNSPAADYSITRDFPFRWRKLSYLVGADDSFVAAQLAVRVLFLERDVHELLTPALAAGNGTSEAAAHISAWARETVGQKLPERVAFLDFPAHLEPRLLRDGDAMSMAHSLEVRPVLLDHAIVEYVMRLPLSLRLQKKRLLFHAMQGILPPALLADLQGRPKGTFTFPFARWLGNDLRATIGAVFAPERLAAAGVLESRRGKPPVAALSPQAGIGGLVSALERVCAGVVV